MGSVIGQHSASATDSELSPLRNPNVSNKWRNLVSYWILGLCNNYGYVVMLSAAHDILSTNFGENVSDTSSEVFKNNSRSCNPTSTGAILLADILPSLLIKVLSPFFTFSIHFRVLIAIILASSGFMLVALASAEWMAILGVVCTSLSSGMGEVAFLSYSAVFDKNVVSTWSSGTGGAGIFGAISYAGLTSLGLRASTTLLVMLIVPILMGISFWLILKHPKGIPLTSKNLNEDISSPNTPNDEVIREAGLTWSEKLRCIPPLIKFMLPLFFVYYFEYFINQGLFELVQFPLDWLSYQEQYRWYQVVYQIGVFISRSSVNIIPIKQIWFMGILQFLNLVLFTLQVLYEFIPSIWIIFALVLWEGLLGGAAYVNVFYRISIEIPEDKRGFSMGITSLADATGITLAGFTSIPAHNALCKLPKML